MKERRTQIHCLPFLLPGASPVLELQSYDGKEFFNGTELKQGLAKMG